ncbi:hypothetical protein QA640_31905 [Bradyrhizobium sp. CB82]|uniref:hypothetical protein n=1 Tax=Bradyrhizobium sp. CB82 TaxID=3039159 RepID=UPI0024B0406B|nr:hypothetical protein [Bradyrhizobium sp. CB82]WFU38970.1 hypothetical protein QA640_31905 [Bradyrhizobium sp. CB82]
MDEDPDAYRILKLRAEILELGSAIRQLQRAGLDDAAAQLSIARKRAMVEALAKCGPQGAARPSIRP